MNKRESVAWVMEAVEEYAGVMVSNTIRRGSMEERRARAEVNRRVAVVIKEAAGVETITIKAGRILRTPEALPPMEETIGRSYRNTVFTPPRKVKTRTGAVTRPYKGD